MIRSELSIGIDWIINPPIERSGFVTKQELIIYDKKYFNPIQSVAMLQCNNAHETNLTNVYSTTVLLQYQMIFVCHEGHW